MRSGFGTSLLKRHSASLAASGFAVGWFLYLGFGRTLTPTHVTWLLRGDWAAYYWGFAFFRNATWAFPLGNTPELFYPFGTSVAFTDANPWVSVFFKLFSPWLATDFQFCGMWFLLCFVLQAILGVKIAAAMGNDKVRQALGGCMFAATPILPSRAPHIALCGLFFVTWGLYLHVRRLGDRADVVRQIAIACLMLGWAAGTHGYLSVMLLVLVLAWMVRLGTTDRALNFRETSLSITCAILLTVATYLLFGYLGWKPAQLTEEGFGQFSGDLTALVNPQGWSRFVRPLPSRPRQWEGFLYLGTGVFFLLLARLVSSTRNLRSGATAILRHYWALMVVLAACWLYSLSDQVAYLGEVVLSLETIYRPFSWLTGIFRSSGRFAWPLHLALIAAGVSGACAIGREWLGRTLLLIALLLQVSELKADRLDFSDVPMRPLSHPVWQSVGQDYQHLRLVPIHLLWVCRFDNELVNRLSYEAYRRKLTFNSGNFMRKEAGVKTLCDRRLGAPEAIDEQTIYVVDRRDLVNVRGSLATCGTLDDLAVCVSNIRDTALLRALRMTPI